MRIGIAVIGALALSACGGSGGNAFDREAASGALAADYDQANPAFNEMLDLAETECRADDDDRFVFSVARSIDDDSTAFVTAVAFGCADRYDKAAEELGWPIPDRD